MAKDPRFTVVEPDGTTKPPAAKPAPAAQIAPKTDGERFWCRILAERKLNEGELAILKQVCICMDQLEAGDLDLKETLALRGFILRGLTRLGFCDRDKKPVGRPPQPVGITFEQLQEHRYGKGDPAA